MVGMRFKNKKDSKSDDFAQYSLLFLLASSVFEHLESAGFL
jgi:hypothetical protein